MGAVSSYSIKSLACLIGLPLLTYIALKTEPGGVGQVLFWLSGLGLLVGCFVFLGGLLQEKTKNWKFLIPGSIALCLAGVAFILTVAVASGGAEGNVAPYSFATAILLAGAAFAAWYNIRGVGLIDGLIVTAIQACFALLVVVIIVIKETMMPKGRR